jgi:hypothetical protein
MLKAWAAELLERRWPDPSSLNKDFRSADVSALPVVIFRFTTISLHVETIFHFGTGVVLVTKVERAAVASADVAISEKLQ